MSFIDRMLRTFHEAINQPSPQNIGDTTAYKFELRARLILEEVMEFFIRGCGYDYDDIVEWLQNQNLTTKGFSPKNAAGEIFPERKRPQSVFKMIDALADTMYVTVGSAIEMNVNLIPHFIEVHTANMRKVTGKADGHGKQQKPEGWKPPDHQKIFDLQEGLKEPEYPTGMFEKYLLTRSDGKRMDPNAFYYTMRYDQPGPKGAAARSALLLFAHTIKVSHSELATDIMSSVLCVMAEVDPKRAPMVEQMIKDEENRREAIQDEEE